MTNEERIYIEKITANVARLTEIVELQKKMNDEAHAEIDRLKAELEALRQANECLEEKLSLRVSAAVLLQEEVGLNDVQSKITKMIRAIDECISLVGKV